MIKFVFRTRNGNFIKKYFKKLNFQEKTIFFLFSLKSFIYKENQFLIGYFLFFII